MQASRISQIVFIIAVVLLLMWVVQLMGQGKVERLETSVFRDYVAAGYIEEAKIYTSTNEIRGTYKPGLEPESADGATKYVTSFHPEAAAEIMSDLDANHVRYGTANPTLWDTIFNPSTLLLIGLFAIPIIFFFWLMRSQMQNNSNNQAMNFGKSRARLAGDGKKRITFDDVAGVDEAVEELHEVVDFLRDPKKYEALGAEIPKGVLLVGPPGCGKTHLAKAVAGEANVPFFYISGSDFVEMFVGVGASRVRDLFDQAKRRAPCLVFIDELDAVGRHRGTGIGGTHDEREQTLNQMLVEMDGFEPNSGIIVLAATNRPDVLDPALLRPGRFDRRIVVDAPDLTGRVGILKIYTKTKPVSDDIDLAELAQRTPGFSGADLKNAVNEAALLAARGGSKEVDREHMYEAIDRVVAGPERKSRIISENEKKVIAYHELGHAIVAHDLSSDPVHKISILPRGQALGYTLQFPEEDRFLISKQQILDRVSVMLGGRSAEELVFNDITTGAQNDLQRSTELVRDMVTKYGMSEQLGPIQFGSKHENPFLGRSMTEERNYSDEIAYRIDQEVKAIVDQCHARSQEVLNGRREVMDLMATRLIEKEYLNRDEFEAIMQTGKLPDRTSPPAAPATTTRPGVGEKKDSKDRPDPAPAPAG